MFEGDLIEGELEIGQVSSRMDEIISARDIVERTMKEMQEIKRKWSGEL